MLLLGVVPTFADDGAKNVLEERIALQALQMERINAQMLAREAELRVERVKNASPPHRTPPHTAPCYRHGRHCARPERDGNQHGRLELRADGHLL